MAAWSRSEASHQNHHLRWVVPLRVWPLAARHIGERRLRNQLKGIGWPASPMLRFGSKAFALRKSWQERYQDWRDAREWGLTSFLFDYNQLLCAISQHWQVLLHR